MHMSFDNLGDRMKDYENVSRLKFTKKSPVIIRLDGKAFHTFTRGFERPFDTIFMKSMQETCKFLCSNIMGCKLAYTQSDEISLLLVDYESNESQQWFDNNIQKMVSVSASMATLAFNKAFQSVVNERLTISKELCKNNTGNTEKAYEKFDAYLRKMNTALFDSRAFVLPKEEVCNYFIWRQQDATRNSILMVAQSMLSFKEMQGVKCDALQELMWQRFNVNWNDYSTSQKRGCCVVKETYDKDEAQRSRWTVDSEIPIFTQDRDCIDKYVFPKSV